MAAHDQDDLLECRIVRGVRKVPRAEVLFKDGTTIAQGDTLTITTQYDGSSQQGFTGVLKLNKDVRDNARVTAVSKTESDLGLKPSSDYSSTTLANALYKAVITDCPNLGFSDETMENKYYDIYGWNDQSAGDVPAGWARYAGANATAIIEIVASYQGHELCAKLDMNGDTSASLQDADGITAGYGTKEFFIATSDATQRAHVRGFYDAGDGVKGFGLMIDSD